MLSRNPQDYMIVTKETYFDVHGARSDNEQENALKELSDEPTGRQTTFWLVSKVEDYKQRYSTKSCPAWVRNVYRQITGDVNV